VRLCIAIAIVVIASGCGAVKAEPGFCSTAAQCTDPAEPFCVNAECGSSCAVNTDCTDPGHALCTGGACVQCNSDTDCADPTASVCDTESHECRGCTADSECTGGVCIEAQGTCVADADVAFVANNGTSTTCTRTAPCETIESAITNAGSRKVIHVLGGDLIDNALMLSGTRILDGENTIFGFSSGTAISVTAPASLTIEGFTFTEPPVANMLPAISVTGPGAVLTLYDVTVAGDGGPAIIAQNSASLVLSHSHVGSLPSLNRHEVDCVNATIRADQNIFEKSMITNGTGACTATVTRNHFDSDNDGSVQISAGQVVMENNLIIHEDGFNDSIFLTGLAAGSVMRFNTIVNTTGAPSDGSALGCDNTVQVTSNIFAYNSAHPVGGTGCDVRYSIFDSVSTTSAGTGNQIVPIDSIFANRATGDYHLSDASIAKGASEPGQTMTTIDLDGNARPNPAGTLSDSGAFEAP
jgi:hypothetical protein